jgi:uncharacterized membrane protein YvbJ
MRAKSGIFITILIVIAFFLFQHRGTPSISVPKNAVIQGDQIKVPVLMQAYQDPQQHWTLTRRQNKQFSVNVYDNYKLVQQFAAGKVETKTANGTDYTVSGEIRIDGQLYEASQLHVNADLRSGFIVLKSENSTDSSSVNHG